jgi:prepilin-type N-terminal cleavage/methylation domain-containing protein
VTGGIKIVKAEKGFTLIEMMVSMAILSVIMLAVLGLMATTNRNYRRTSDMARGQYNLRVAMFHMARDIRNAGSSGIPLGFDRADQTTPLVPIKPVDKTQTLDFTKLGVIKKELLRGIQLTARTDKYVDAIDIRANFTMETAILVNNVMAGTNTLTVTNGDIFCPPDADCAQYPVETILIGNDKNVEKHTLNSVTIIAGNTHATVTLGEQINIPFLAGNSIVAPVIHRRYFIEERTHPATGRMVRTLIRRDYYTNHTVDTEMAAYIHDLQVTYNLADYTYSGGQILGTTDKIYSRISSDPFVDTGLGEKASDADHNPLLNPWQIRAVEVTLTTVTVPRTPTPTGGRLPVFTDMTQIIRTRNVGLHRLDI